MEGGSFFGIDSLSDWTGCVIYTASFTAAMLQISFGFKIHNRSINATDMFLDYLFGGKKLRLKFVA